VNLKTNHPTKKMSTVPRKRRVHALLVGRPTTGKHIALTLAHVDDNPLTMETTMTEYLTALYYLVFWVLLPLGAISAIPVLGMYCLFMDIAEENQKKNKTDKI